MPIPDRFQQICRLRREIAQMVVQYQDTGKYSWNGKTYNNLAGILEAWDEIEDLGGEL